MHVGLTRFVGRFRRAQRGATAVEFGIVALPFAVMLFAVLELGLVFVIDSSLESAVVDTGRLVRTGQAQAASKDRDAFKEAVCSRMTIFEDSCNARLKVDVRTVTDFSAPPPDPMEDGEEFSEDGLGYDDGGARSLVVVSAWYNQPLFTPFLKDALSELGDGSAWITATTAFRNEPFGG